MAGRVFHSVSLFSNCGAGDIGYAKAGFRFDVMAELDPRRLEVCLLNHPNAIGVPGDLRKTWKKVVTRYHSTVGRVRPALLAACPPCQGMSTARSHRGSESDPDAGMKDNRNLLVTVITQVAKELRPRIIVVENVQAFFTRQVRHPKTRRPISAAKLLIEYLNDAYEVFPLLTDLCHYGVPQTRRRTFLTFVDRKEPCLKHLNERGRSPYPVRTHEYRGKRKPITAMRALKAMRLPSLDAKTVAVAMSSHGRGLHAVPVWSSERYAMVNAIPRDTGRSAWQNDRCLKCCRQTAHEDAVTCRSCGALLPRPIVADSNGKHRLITGFRSSTYSRMHSKRPAATITTASGHIGSNHTIHPFENRLLSTFECALLQTLPRSFKWGKALKKWGHTNVREMIGEAVPPLFTHAHGRVIRALLEGRYRVRTARAHDRDVIRATRKLRLVSSNRRRAK